MRVLSFIPAFLLAATSFVAAAPTSTPADAAPACQPSVPSSAPSTTGSGSGNDAALQPFISIIVGATAQIQPLCDQLTSSQSSGTPDVDVVADVVVKITAVVSDIVVQLKAQAQVDLTGLDLTSLCAAIYALLGLVCTVLNTLVAIVISLVGNITANLQTVICDLLNAVTGLVGCLQIFVTASVSVILGPLFALVCGAVDLLLSIVVKIDVLVGVSN